MGEEPLSGTQEIAVTPEMIEAATLVILDYYTGCGGDPVAIAREILLASLAAARGQKSN